MLLILCENVRDAGLVIIGNYDKLIKGIQLVFVVQ